MQNPRLEGEKYMHLTLDCIAYIVTLLRELSYIQLHFVTYCYAIIMLYAIYIICNKIP